MSNETQSPPASDSELPANGAAWATILSASIGATGFGVLTDLSECSTGVSRALQWDRPAGSLSGVAICAILIWAAVWAVLHARWKGRELRNQQMLLVGTCFFISAALVATFPPFYELFVTSR